MSDERARRMERQWRETRAWGDWLAWAYEWRRAGHPEAVDLVRTSKRLRVTHHRYVRLASHHAEQAIERMSPTWQRREELVHRMLVCSEVLGWRILRLARQLRRLGMLPGSAPESVSDALGAVRLSLAERQEERTRSREEIAARRVRALSASRGVCRECGATPATPLPGAISQATRFCAQCRYLIAHFADLDALEGVWTGATQHAPGVFMLPQPPEPEVTARVRDARIRAFRDRGIATTREIAELFGVRQQLVRRAYRAIYKAER